MKNVPWRMILLLVIIVLVALFSGFNLSTVEISLGFYVLEDVPLFLALIGAFIAGALVMVPFSLFVRRSKTNKAPASVETPTKRRRFRKNKSAAQPSDDTTVVSEESATGE